MSFNEKLLAFENRIIDVLTTFTWWTEVRFDKDNIYWARIFSILSCLFGCVHALYSAETRFETMEYFMFWFNLAVALLFILIGAYFVIFKESALDDLRNLSSQGTPNPCRVSKTHSMLRRFCMFLALMRLISLSFTFGTLYILFFSLSCFVLACDSIPPGEKSRRKFMYESQEMNLSPIKQ